MEFILDLHVHSKYSRGTSHSMDLENIYRFAKIKGIQVIATGDFTHPAWFNEIRKKLEPAEDGLFKLKNKLAKKQDKTLPAIIKKKSVRFILSAEISNIYSKGGKVRKMHNVILAPDFKTVSKINNKLSEIGNLTSDGRPILGLDSKKLLKITVNSNPLTMLIPAHIWTPWFSLFGSKSGFNSIEEAFEELSSNIYAIETGLSSDPFMNWRLDQLKNLTILSNSDAHSPLKMGREANILNCKPTYKNIIKTIQSNDKRMIGTIEFFPQEGKYHCDGHRKCNVVFTSEQTKKHKGICPKCNKPLVVGVNYRVGELADEKSNYKPKQHKKVEYIIPLLEILSELGGFKKPGKKVMRDYEKLYSVLGDEFSILRKVPIEKIKEAGFEKLAGGIERMRKGQVHITPGFDGVFGIIKVFENNTQAQKYGGQKNLFE
ncbi:MAG: DNA helicase UvrD [Candidatus Moranbacteria bacterium]|nr:DNA helicase UvrD [Candidatus Moranbacteria bacterium]